MVPKMPKKHSVSLKPKVSLRNFCYAAMLIALTFVLERFLPVVSLPTFRITLAFIPMMCCGMLLGPVWCAVAYGVVDLLGWPVMGLTPIPLILASRIVEGFIYGFVLHRERPRFAPHAILAALAAQAVCGAGLTTFGLAHFFGAPYPELLISRLPQLAAIFALQLAVFPVLVKLRSELGKTGIIAL